MTWGKFRELFMGKFFSASARHAKAREFLELACFRDDYVSVDMAKVEKFMDGLKLSI